jgi:hypothetical protein
MNAETRLPLPFVLKFMLFVSLFGALTTLLLVADSPTARTKVFLQGPLVGSIFIVICASGIVAALWPRKCSISFGSHVFNATFRQEPKAMFSLGWEAHHLSCGKFSTHTIRFGRVSYCAACSGLALGAILAVAMSATYFLFRVGIERFSLLCVAIGLLGPVLGFMQFRLKGWVRAGANAFFVFGTSLVVIGMDQQIGSFDVDLYVIGLAVFWIMTRIAISQWDHSRICLTCNHQCK